jgi:hypothetical protein
MPIPAPTHITLVEGLEHKHAWPCSHVCDLQGAADGGMEAFLQVEAADAGTIWEEKIKSKWRRSCFQMHAGRQGVVDRWVSHLDRTARQLVPSGCPLLAWGSGKFHTAQRGNAAAPLGTLQHALWQCFPVVMVDKAYHFQARVRG